MCDCEYFGNSKETERNVIIGSNIELTILYFWFKSLCHKHNTLKSNWPKKNDPTFLSYSILYFQQWEVHKSFLLNNQYIAPYIFIR